MMSKMKSMGRDKKTCVQECWRLDGKLARYSASDGLVYIITNAQCAEPSGGHQAQVSGTVKKGKLTISEIKVID